MRWHCVAEKAKALCVWSVPAVVIVLELVPVAGIRERPGLAELAVIVMRCDLTRAGVVESAMIFGQPVQIVVEVLLVQRG